MGPKNMSPEAVQYYEQLFARMMETDSWKAATERLGWLDAWQDSATFGVFLDQQQGQFRSVLTELGLLR